MEDSDQESTQSGALIGSNDDLLTEILLRLPVTSIVRFKSVSKHWRWLLSHRTFTLRYDVNLSKSHGLFVRNAHFPFAVENQITPILTLHFCFDRYGIKILQSCNGLLLCCSDLGKKRTRKYYVLNPTTKQFSIIPSVPGGQEVHKSICFMGLAFHRTACVQYKVVCIRSIEPLGELLQIQIYSSDTKKWKISVESFSANHYTFDKGVYLNGAIHFAPSDQCHLYFELDSEQVQSLLLPMEIMSTETSITYFGESRGHLHLVTSYYGETLVLHDLNVYEMLSDSSGWFVKYQVEFNDFPHAFPQIIFPKGYAFYVVEVVRGENKDDMCLVLAFPGKIVRFNLHDKSLKHVCHLDTSEFYVGALNVHHHIETIASI